MNNARTLLALAFATGITATSQAQLVGNLLLRQGSFTNTGFGNQWSTDNTTFLQSTGMGSMVTSTSTWNISNIQVLQLGDSRPGFGNTWFGNVTQAWLNVSRQTNGAPDPSINPFTNINSGPSNVISIIVPVVLDLPTSNANGANQSFRLSVSTDTIPQLQGLVAGDYVFSLVPIADRTGQFGKGQTFTSAASQLGSQNDYVRNPYGGANLPSGTNWGTLAQDFGAAPNTQWAIGINGTAVPEPTTFALLSLGAVAMLRRRRQR